MALLLSTVLRENPMQIASESYLEASVAFPYAVLLLSSMSTHTCEKSRQRL